jgi:hypothetical protein
MRADRFLALALTSLVAIAAVPASTGADQNGCGIAPMADANFKRLEREQSPGAQKICAMYLNMIDAHVSH